MTRAAESIATAIASRNAPNEMVCGDSGAVYVSASQLVAVVADGLGHGPAAREASQAAIAYVSEHRAASIDAVLRGLDRALSPTRGAAVSLLSFDLKSQVVLFAGVGNVEVRSHSATPLHPPTAPGIVGRGVRSVRVWDAKYQSGDRFVLFTDGVSTRVDLATLQTHTTPQLLANAILTGFTKGTDDALVLALCVGSA